MTKSDLIDAIAADADVSKACAQRMLDAVAQRITQALAQGQTVAWAGFGTFAVSERAARTGRNPRTGEEIQIEASKAAKFSAGKVLKDALNGR